MESIRCTPCVLIARHYGEEQDARVLYKGTGYCEKHLRDVFAERGITTSENDVIGDLAS